VLSLDEAIQFRKEQGDLGKTVVFTNGCFDLLHPGHIQYLEQAKELGDILIIGLNSDASVNALKGPSRPINTLEDRAIMLSALRCVDAVVAFEDETPIPLIQELAPNIHVKGGDYTKESLPEYDVVTAYGGQVVILPFLEGKSSTALINKIKI